MLIAGGTVLITRSSVVLQHHPGMTGFLNHQRDSRFAARARDGLGTIIRTDMIAGPPVVLEPGLWLGGFFREPRDLGLLRLGGGLACGDIPGIGLNRSRCETREQGRNE